MLQIKSENLSNSTHRSLRNTPSCFGTLTLTLARKSLWDWNSVFCCLYRGKKIKASRIHQSLTTWHHKISLKIQPALRTLQSSAARAVQNGSAPSGSSPFLPGFKGRARTLCFPYSPLLALHPPSIFCRPGRSLCSHHRTEHCPEELPQSASSGWSAGSPSSCIPASFAVKECEPKRNWGMKLWARGSPRPLLTQTSEDTQWVTRSFQQPRLGHFLPSRALNTVTSAFFQHGF